MKGGEAKVKIPIPEDVFIKMKMLQQHGDFSTIARKNNMPVHTVQIAWNERKGTPKVVNAIIRFYDHREKWMKENEVSVIDPAPAQKEFA